MLSARSRFRARPAFFVLLTALVVLALGRPASARESAGTFSTVPTTPTSSTCSPVQSLKTDGVTGVGDTGLSSISADYAVKPCDSKQVVIVAVRVYEAFDPTNVLRDEPAAPLSGKFTILGVRVGVSYRVTVSVSDAATGALVGEASRLASAPVPTGA